MTVRQYGQQTFNIPSALVAEHIREVLKRNQAYKQVRESTEATMFTLNVKPNSLLLGTDMTVVLNESESGTTVTATTTSQFLIIGDVGGFYYRYVRDFLATLRDSLIAENGRPLMASEPSYKMEISWVEFAAIFVLTLLLIWLGFTLYFSVFQVSLLLVGMLIVVNLIRIVRGGRLGI